jgi:hypothetical protein
MVAENKRIYTVSSITDVIDILQAILVFDFKKSNFVPA